MGEQAGHAFRGNQWVGGRPAGAVDPARRKGESTVLREDFKRRASVSGAHGAALAEALRNTGYAGDPGLAGHFEAGQAEAARREAIISRIQEEAQRALKGSPEAAGQSPLSSEHRELLEKISNGEVQYVKEQIGEGISRSFKVWLEGDDRLGPPSAIYKPDQPPVGRHGDLLRGDAITDMVHERERAAWEVARYVGMENFVAPTTTRELTVGGGPAIHGMKPEGSIQAWVAGDFQTARDVYDPYAKFGKDIGARQQMAMYDYVMNNQDRHEGNWMVDKNTGQIQLIDHGLMLGDHEYSSPTFNRQMTRRAMRDEEYFQKDGKVPGVDNPKDFKSPAEVAKVYVEKLPQMTEYLKSRGFSEKAINGFENRVKYAAEHAKRWGDLHGHIWSNKKGEVEGAGRPAARASRGANPFANAFQIMRIGGPRPRRRRR